MKSDKDLEQKEFYSEIKYPGQRSTFSYLWAKRISKYFNKNEKFIVLDAGCGSGNHICAILDYFKNSIAIGVDQSKPSLEILKRKSRIMKFENRINCLNQSYLDEFKLDEKADISLAIGTIGHSSDPDLALKNIVKNTKKNGLIGLMLYSEFGTYNKNKLIEAINMLNPNNDNDFLDYVHSFEKKFPKILYEPLNKNLIKLRDYFSHYLRRFFKNKSYGYLASLPKEIFYKDTYLTKIEKSFSFDNLIKLIENNNLEIIEFYSLGKINRKKIPLKWLKSWETLSFLDKAKISSLINNNPSSWSILTRLKN